MLLPIALIASVMIKPGAHGRLVVFADALGFAALSLLALQIIVSGRWASTTRSPRRSRTSSGSTPTPRCRRCA
jgi:hypothetical protein